MTQVVLPTAARASVTIAAPPATPVHARLQLYFVFAYVFTWLCWGLVALSTRQMFGLPISADLLMLLGGLGPLVAALGIVTFESGWPGMRALLSQLLRWRVSTIWYAVALLGWGDWMVFWSCSTCLLAAASHRLRRCRVGFPCRPSS